MQAVGVLRVRGGLVDSYGDVLTAAALETISALAPFDADRRQLMRRGSSAARAASASASGSRSCPRTRRSAAPTSWSATRAPAASTAARSRRPAAAVDSGHRPGGAAARALGREHPQRRLRAAVGRRRLDVRRRRRARPGRQHVARQPAQPEAGHSTRADVFLTVAEQVAGEMNAWAHGFLGRPIIARLARAARLHDADLPRRAACTSTTGTSALGDGAASRRRSSTPRSTSRQSRSVLRADGRVSVVLYLPKIQTAEEAALWNDMLSRSSAISVCRAARSRPTCWSSSSKRRFQLMEIRAALGPHFVGFNTGRWDYINSVADAMAWDPDVRQPEHRRHHHDLRLHARLRGPRAPRRQHAGPARAATRCGRAAWSRTSRSDRRPACRRAWRARSPAPSASSARAPAASGSRTGRWSTSSGRCGRRPARPISSGRAFPRLTYTQADADGADRARSRRRARSAARAI